MINLIIIQKAPYLVDWLAQLGKKETILFENYLANQKAKLYTCCSLLMYLPSNSKDKLIKKALIKGSNTFISIDTTFHTFTLILIHTFITFYTFTPAFFMTFTLDFTNNLFKPFIKAYLKACI